MSSVRSVLVVTFVLIVNSITAYGQTCVGTEPASGNCAAPRTISGEVGHHVVFMDLHGATGTGRLCDAPVGNMVYFTVTPEVTGTVSISSCHPMTAFDTVIEVTTGAELCESGTQVGCNDDFVSDDCPTTACFGRPSQLSFHGNDGTKYLIRVGSYNNNPGECPLCLGLIVTVGSPCGEIPRNLICEEAIEFEGVPGTYEASVDVEGSATLPFEPQPDCASAIVGHSVWFSIMPESPGWLTFTTCDPNTTYDTVVQAYTDCSGVTYSPDCNDDDTGNPACENGCDPGFERGSTVSFAADADVMYYFEVGSYGDNLANCDPLCLGVRATLTEEECTQDAQCDDGNPCTEDSCVERACVNAALPDGSACTDDGNPCTYDQCHRGNCTHPDKPAGAACGDPSDSDCDNPDTCNGAGSCEPNHEPYGVGCTSDGNACTHDLCNGSGTCTHPPEGAGTPCGDPSTTDCTDPDTCTGSGYCSPRHHPAGTSCTGDGNVCTQDVCNGSGSCTHPPEAPGFLCGDSSDTDCTDPDSCDGGGNCAPRHEPSGTDCSSDGNECTEDVCNGSGTCTHPPEGYGMPCGDPSDTNCTDPDWCNGLGACAPNHEPAGAPCPDGLFCNGDNTCNGSGTCLPGTSPCPPENPCDEANDRCGTDCNNNRVDDLADLEAGTSVDCNGNVTPDECDITAGSALDCNANGVPDSCDIESGQSEDNNDDDVPDECQSPSGGQRVRINEVMPRPIGRQAEWIELYVGADSEVDGWQIVNRDGVSYTIPAELPMMPAGSFLLIMLDGQGPASDDYDVSDGLAVLHTPAGLVNILDAAADQVALYRGGAGAGVLIHDFVAYGAPPGETASAAVEAGIWHSSWWVSMHVGGGAEVTGAALPANRSIGVLPGHGNDSPNDWAVYEQWDLTPGAPNPIPRAGFSTVADGAVMTVDGIAIGWGPVVPGARYRFQMDDDQAFATPQIDTLLDDPVFQPDPPPTAGDHWWRVAIVDADGRTSGWSYAKRVNVVGLAAVEDEVVLPMTWLRQAKDTKLLCHDGCNEGDSAAPGPKETWDSPHPDAILTHGRKNCVRASIAMIVTNYGGSLSQDRISYEYFERQGDPLKDWGGVGNPEKDLGHDLTTIIGGGSSTGERLFEWALGLGEDAIYEAGGAPTFAQVKGWIDAGRPIMRGDGISHETVIAGYRTFTNGFEQVRHFDPWSGMSWVTLDSLPFGHHFVPPASAPGVRSDESTIWTDSDIDGIMDWDEQIRFHTGPSESDTDGDLIPDKLDMRGYVFKPDGTYDLDFGDFDGDGLAKERDLDNDGDGEPDTCEDDNLNGKLDYALGETSNLSYLSSSVDLYEPNDSQATAALLLIGSINAVLDPYDLDYYYFDTSQFANLDLEITYEVLDASGHRLKAQLDQTLATESVVGTLELDRTQLAPGHHVLRIWGEQGTSMNCYDVTMSTTSATIDPDAYDDETPPSEPRNDSFTDAAVVPDVITDSMLLAGSIDDLNHDLPSDVDFFTIQLPPATNPQTSAPECCQTVGPDTTQGRFRLRLFPYIKRAFDITVYNSDGTEYAATSGMSYILECPHNDFADGNVTFSVRDPSGLNLYDIGLGYNRCATRFYPPWFLDFDPPAFRWEVPEFLDRIRWLFPFDPQVQHDYFSGAATEPFPAEYLVFDWSATGPYVLDVHMPGYCAGAGCLDISLINQAGELVTMADWVGSPAGGLSPPPTKRIDVPSLEEGTYFLKLENGSFGTDVVLASVQAADIDTDGDVDLRDFAELQRCFGRAVGGGECVGSDLDRDAGVGLSDLSLFVAALHGPAQ